MDNDDRSIIKVYDSLSDKVIGVLATPHHILSIVEDSLFRDAVEDYLLDMCFDPESTTYQVEGFFKPLEMEVTAVD